MREYHDHDQRLIYKTCPGCRADLEQDAEECLFCDHSFQQEEISEYEPAPLEEVESKSNSFFTVVALNVIISLVGATLSSWESKREVPTYRHPPRMSVNDRELFSRFFKEHGKSIPAELRDQLEPQEKTRRVKVISVTFSNHPRVKLPYRQALFPKRQAASPLDRFKAPEELQ